MQTSATFVRQPESGLCKLQHVGTKGASLEAQLVKSLPAMQQTWVQSLGSLPALARSPGGGHGNPLQYSGLENPHGQRSLAGYSPWGHKESDTTE